MTERHTEVCLEEDRSEDIIMIAIRSQDLKNRMKLGYDSEIIN